MRKFFAREGIPRVLVTDNGTHFTAASFNTWLDSIGCLHVYSPPRHPQSNGIAENVVKSLKNCVKASEPASFTELDKCVDNFLFQYRISDHAATKHPPAVLFKGRQQRSCQIQPQSGSSREMNNVCAPGSSSVVKEDEWCVC